MADEAKDGSVVHLEYVGRLDNDKGDLFDTNVKEEAEKEGLPTEGRPFELLKVEVGKHQVVPGFEEALYGMKEGETKEVTLTSDKAYGEPNDKLIQDVPKELFKDAPVELKAGITLAMQHPSGQVMPVKVLEVGENTVKLDGNHPLAGKTLYFKITLKKLE